MPGMHDAATATVNATFFLCQSYSSDSTRTEKAGESSVSATVKSYRFVAAGVSPRTTS